MVKSKLNTEKVSYCCPNCKTYNIPYMHNKEGIAFIQCKNCKEQYKTSVSVSKDFRKLCSKIASNPVKSSTYYTSAERKVKKYLERIGYEEGIDFIHNVRVCNKGKEKQVYYWLDFYIPELKLVIEASPRIWHREDREVAEKRKYDYLSSKGLTVLTYDDRVLRKLRHIKKPKKKLNYLINPLDYVNRK